MIENIVLMSIALIAILIACWQDIKTQEVPHWIWISFALIGITLRASFPGYFFLAGVFGFVFTLVVGTAVYYFGFWGGGDAKLLWALGWLMGPQVIVFTVLLLAFSNLYALVVWLRTGKTTAPLLPIFVIAFLASLYFM